MVCPTGMSRPPPMPCSTRGSDEAAGRPRDAAQHRAGDEEHQRRTALTREAIVRAAILLADAEGLDAVSIRRVASELQARAMSLYTYIERKEDLFDLMADEVAAEVLVPGELPRDWREATVVIARPAGSRATRGRGASEG
jgi:AcrR family transcriptional regulator